MNLLSCVVNAYPSVILGCGLARRKLELWPADHSWGGMCSALEELLEKGFGGSLGLVCGLALSGQTDPPSILRTPMRRSLKRGDVDGSTDETAVHDEFRREAVALW